MRYEFLLLPVCFRKVVSFAVVLEIVTQGVCRCATTPRATSRKTAPFFFIRISQSRFFLVNLFSEKHLSVVYFVSKCKLFDKDESVFYHKDLIRKQNLALSWFKPASTLSSKYECWCEFEKDLKLLSVSKISRIFMGESFLIELLSTFTRASGFSKFASTLELCC